MNVEHDVYAFPASVAGTENYDSRGISCPGMTLRDYFAAKALVAILLQGDRTDDLAYEATTAWRMADAMLATR